MMKAVRIYEYGGPETLKYETDVPEPMLGADMVRDIHNGLAQL